MIMLSLYLGSKECKPGLVVVRYQLESRHLLDSFAEAYSTIISAAYMKNRLNHIIA